MQAKYSLIHGHKIFGSDEVRSVFLKLVQKKKKNAIGKLVSFSHPCMIKSCVDPLTTVYNRHMHCKHNLSMIKTEQFYPHLLV